MLHPMWLGEITIRQPQVIGFTMQRRASDIRIGNFEKVEISDFRSDAFCFLAHAAPDYLPMLTNWMQSPWFLKLWGKLNLCHPPFLH
jgi:hypothetical protein